MADNIRDAVEEAVTEAGITDETDEWGELITETTVEDETTEEETKEIIEEEKTEESDEIEEEKEKEEKKEDDPKPEEEKEVDQKGKEFETSLDNDQLKQAEDLYTLLKGPNAVEAVKQMAERAGLLNQTAPVEEPKEETSEFKKVVSEALGEEFKFLTDRITNAFTAYDKIAQQKAETFRATEAKSRTDIVLETELRNFGKEHDLSIDGSSSDPISNKMSELAGSFRFEGSGVNEFKVYLTRLHTLAVSETEIDTENVSRIKKINKNLRESEPGSVSTSERSVRKGPEKVDARMAVEAALRGIQFSEE